MGFISKPFGYFLDWLNTIFNGNFALSVFIFTLVLNLALLPLTIKTQKTTSKQARLRPKLDALKKKYGDDKQKHSQAMQDLYARENVSMSGGCLPMVIRMLIIFAVYYVVSNPLQYMLHYSVAEIQTITEALKNAGYEITRSVDIMGHIKNGTITGIGLDSGLVSRLVADVASVDFNFLGIDLTQTPTFSLNLSKMFSNNLWIIPIASFASNMLNSIISMYMQKKTNPDAPNMAGMMLTMPLLSLWITFTVPCALGFYWTLSGIIQGGFQLFTQMVYNPNKIIAGEQAAEIIKAAKIEEGKLAAVSQKEAADTQ